MLLSFEEVIQNNDRRLRFIAWRYGNARHQEDVYQEILVQLWRSFGEFRGDSNITTWIYRVALNAALMWQRKETRWNTTGAKPDEAYEPHGQCQAKILEDFFTTLNEVDSMILMMHLDNIEIQEVAAITGLSTNAIHIRINRLKQKFNDRYVD